MTTVSHGSSVQVLAYGEEWALVRTKKGNVGYLKCKYLIVQGADAMVACQLYAQTTQATALLADPDATAQALAPLEAGAAVLVSAYDDQWAYVHDGTQIGYVRKAHLKVIP